MSDLTLLPILLVVVPLVTAAFLLAVGRFVGGAGRVLALVATLANTAIAFVLAGETLGQDGRPIRTEIAGFPAAEGGIELFVDGISAVVLGLIALVSLGVLVASFDRRRQDSFYALYVLLMAGLSGMVVTNDLFNLYVFLEISGLATYALIASDGSGRSALASLKYLLVGTVGASLYLLGVGYAFVATGYLNMVQLEGAFAEIGHQEPLVQTAFALIAAGLVIKIALFPVHTWQPDAYTEAPDRVTALVAALVSTTAAYALVRISLGVFTPAFFEANSLIHTLLLALAGASVVAGSVLAVMQREVKRMLAYSSVAQFGLVVLGIYLLNGTALTGTVIHLLGHAIIKVGLFLGVAAFATAYGVRTVSEYDGLAERAPYASAAVAVLALALVGMPPTVGFVGKFYIAIGAFEAGAWALLAIIVASTVLTLGYVMRLLERMYFADPPDSSPVSPPAADLSTDGGDPTDESATDGDHTVDEPSNDGPSNDVSRTDTAAAGRISRPLLAVVIVAALATLALGVLGSTIEGALAATVEVLV
ncbi:monovalent cation/H+ antiporter subunit D [Halovivax asiaticus JCM 14624]|uniref:Monovalent cation/H+ antiporter subunit D n=1 Tax=Halovivax asiaticus JCM 14624 TaxID=1227490 RepID=M0BT40_9EURY|nr:proton-conducting transporter membrane subunit [Halovivax asiaticus]ELZ14196.1 monovalent cation/H+ antiporter subunit D [Halovivax asiaticus JCM 14624]